MATIPRAPEEVSATAENDTSVTVSWARALGPDTARTLDHYTVNLTFVTYVSLPSTIYYILSTVHQYSIVHLMRYDPVSCTLFIISTLITHT